MPGPMSEPYSGPPPMSAKFTLGPWRAEQDERPNMSWNWEINANDGEDRICWLAHDGTDANPRGVANANLISAAPEMWEVLTEIEAWGGKVSDDCWDRLQSALRKANGENK